jgi:tRNA threonylcarbamoyladenosine biosynthesis protein TsaE
VGWLVHSAAGQAPHAALTRVTRRVETASGSETEALGAELAEALAPGDVVLVEGELGVGKTTFVRGACRALGVEVPVTSPTFTIGQRYSGRVTVSHLDLFRVPELDARELSLLDDYVGADTIAFIEWPPEREESLAALGRIACRVRLAHDGGDRRILEIDVR